VEWSVLVRGIHTCIVIVIVEVSTPSPRDRAKLRVTADCGDQLRSSDIDRDRELHEMLVADVRADKTWGG
jgi:hypothetical protein